MKPRLPVIFTLLWLGGASLGVSLLAVYDCTPGMDAGSVQDWPAHSRIPRALDRPTLIMFAHPNCPCTRASMQEFAELMARCGSQVKAFVFFLQPESAGDDWRHTDLWRSAEAIPGVKAIADDAAREARLFQAMTSGHVVLYDEHGTLLFSGGITASRGHVGDNAGSAAILQLLGHEDATKTVTPVFGCSLLDPEPEMPKE